MLRFFRTIRKKLIDEDNVRRYLLYAAGEILLVVIGILLALQVNTWREHIKRDQRELEVVQLLIRDLKANHRSMEVFANFLDEQNEATIRFIDGVKEEKKDSVLANSYHTLNIWNYRPSYPTFDGLKQNGTIDIIANAEVRDTVIYYHEEMVTYLDDLRDSYKSAVTNAQTATGRYLMRSWVPSDSDWIREQVYDFEHMINDTEMLSRVSAAGNIRSWLSYRLNTLFIPENEVVTAKLENYQKELLK